MTVESSLPNTSLALSPYRPIARRLFYLLPANANHPGKVPPSLAAAQHLDFFNCLLLLRPEQSRGPFSSSSSSLMSCEGFTPQPPSPTHTGGEGVRPRSRKWQLFPNLPKSLTLCAHVVTLPCQRPANLLPPPTAHPRGSTPFSIKPPVVRCIRTQLDSRVSRWPLDGGISCVKGKAAQDSLGGFYDFFETEVR